MVMKEEGHARRSYLCGMFGRISGKYDIVNRLMSFGMDRSWRRILLARALLPRGGRLLDVGIGTGDIALKALKIDPMIRVTGIDFTLQMMRVGRERPGGYSINWCNADALHLPFPEATFDAVTSGFLARNVIDVGRAFEEQMRVVRPGGRVVCLDTSPVPHNMLRPLVLFHLNILIPFLGFLITRQRDAYKYLPSSTHAFKDPEVLAEIMSGVGLKDVTFQSFMFGNIALHWGVRPREDGQ